MTSCLNEADASQPAAREAFALAAKHQRQRHSCLGERTLEWASAAASKKKQSSVLAEELQAISTSLPQSLASRLLCAFIRPGMAV